MALIMTHFHPKVFLTNTPNFPSRSTQGLHLSFFNEPDCCFSLHYWTFSPCCAKTHTLTFSSIHSLFSEELLLHSPSLINNPSLAVIDAIKHLSVCQNISFWMSMMRSDCLQLGKNAQIVWSRLIDKLSVHSSKVSVSLFPYMEVITVLACRHAQTYI